MTANHDQYSISEPTVAAFDRLRGYWKSANPNPLYVSHRFLAADLFVSDWMEFHFDTDWDDVTEGMSMFLRLTDQQRDELDRFVGYVEERAYKPDEFHAERTLGEVSVWLCERGLVPRFDAISICGRECRSAGNFLGLEALAKSHLGDAVEIGPSVPFASVFTSPSDLFTYWLAVRWVSGRRISELKSGASKSGFVAAVAGLFGFVSWGCVLLRVVPDAFFFVAMAVFLAALAVGALVLAFPNLLDKNYSAASHLPDGIETFGQLAKVLDLARPI